MPSTLLATTPLSASLLMPLVRLRAYRNRGRRRSALVGGQAFGLLSHYCRIALSSCSREDEALDERLHAELAVVIGPAVSAAVGISV
jgi:hypothetical protein